MGLSLERVGERGHIIGKNSDWERSGDENLKLVSKNTG